MKGASHISAQRVSEVIPDNVAEGHKRCNRCAQPYPLDQFWPTQDTCKECMRNDREKILQRKKEQQLDNVAAIARTMMLSVSEQKLSVPHICEYMSYLFDAAGGPQALAKSHVEHLMNTELGSARALTAYRDIAKLTIYATEHRATAPDVESLDSDQLEAACQMIARDLILNQVPENNRAQVLQLIAPEGGDDTAHAG